MKSLDHVAVWTPERDALAEILTSCCDMHEIERTDEFTLVGGDATEGKLTLFTVEDDRAEGMLERILVRGPDLAAAQKRLAARGVKVELGDEDSLEFVAPGRVPVGLVEGPRGEPGDLDGIVLAVAEPETTAAALAPLLQTSANGDGGRARLEIAGRHIALVQADVGGGSSGGDRPPVLNHIALLVDDVEAVGDEATRCGFELDRTVDAPNTRAVFVVGPEGILLEYVEHKASFALV